MVDPSLALLLIALAPLAAAVAGYVLAAAGRPGAARASAGLGLLALAGAAVLSAQLLTLKAAAFSVPWLQLPDALTVLRSGGAQSGLALDFALAADRGQLLFMLTTAVISVAVLLFALRERRDDPRRAQFFATLTLFAGSMLLFLAADTLLVLYFAWELMGLCSYLLIAHPATAEARRAARQAFWTTRATDFGLLFAVVVMFARFGWTRLSDIDVPGLLQRLVTAAGGGQSLQLAVVSEGCALIALIGLLALLACIGKAAQFPLSFWLPDAMVAPAPVSALLHAATMVAAGPYLLIRLTQLFQPTILNGMTQAFLPSQLLLLAATLTGGVTLLLGGAMALCARDAKRILAYSTLSQLGLVVLSVGVLAEESGLYFLLAHAWIKAPLFLAVGYLALTAAAGPAGAAEAEHSASLSELAGSAWRHPLALWALVAGGLALAGLWPLGGSFGKEQILYALLTRHRAEPMAGFKLGQYLPLASAGWTIGAVLFILSLPLTAAYVTRLVGVLIHRRPGRAAALAADLPPALRGFEVGLGAALLTALVGCLGWPALFGWFRAEFSTAGTLKWKWAAEGSAAGLLVLATGLIFTLAGIGLTWWLRVARPAEGLRAVREGSLAPLIDFFAHGMYLREFFGTLIGKTGELLALLAAIFEEGGLSWLTLRCGTLGRGLAWLARFTDDHIVEGARYWACELWWGLKRWHARRLQTGVIHNYMFVVLLSAALLCLLTLKPLAEIFSRILGRL